jgi:Protein of unknown function (DUF3592)
LSAIVLLTVVYWFFAIALVYPLFRSAYRQRTMSHWPHYDGVVTGHDFVHDSHKAKILVQVRYEADGQVVNASGERSSRGHYSGSRTTGYGRSPLDVAKMVAGRTPPGTAVRVVVNPANTREIYVLDRQYPLFILGFAVAAVLIAFFAMLVYAISV